MGALQERLERTGALARADAVVRALEQNTLDALHRRWLAPAVRTEGDRCTLPALRAWTRQHDFERLVRLYAALVENRPIDSEEALRLARYLRKSLLPERSRSYP